MQAAETKVPVDGVKAGDALATTLVDRPKPPPVPVRTVQALSLPVAAAAPPAATIVDAVPPPASGSRPTLPDAPAVKLAARESSKPASAPESVSTKAAPAVETPKPPPSAATLVPAVEAKPVVEAKTDAKPAAEAKAPARDTIPNLSATPAPVVSDAAIDEISIPPAGDLDDHFFAEGTKSEHDLARARLSDPGTDIDLADPKAVHKMTPAVRARRARFARYVKAAVAVSALLCLAAAVRVGAARAKPDAGYESSAAAAIHAEPAPANAEPLAQPKAEPAAIVAEPALAAANTAPAKVEAPNDPAPAKDAPIAAPAAAAKTDGTAPATAVVDPAADLKPAKTAAQEKRDSRNALERGAFAKATEAGERSVALDPTDGDAWLLLGAAYQARGKVADARRCFNACLKQGKRGPIGECRAMLQ